MGPSVVLERQEGHARAPLRAYFGVKHGGTLRQIADHLDMPPDCDYPMVDINNWRDSLQYILSHPGSLDKPWATLGARSQYFSHLSSLVWGGACSPQFVIFSMAFI